MFEIVQDMLRELLIKIPYGSYNMARLFSSSNFEYRKKISHVYGNVNSSFFTLPDSDQIIIKERATLYKQFFYLIFAELRKV